MSNSPRIGQTFVSGRDKHVARALLESAERLDGYDVMDVRTVQNGFVVPDAVADDAREALQADPPDDDPDSQF